MNLGIAAMTSSSIWALLLYRGGLARELVASLGICIGRPDLTLFARTPSKPKLQKWGETHPRGASFHILPVLLRICLQKLQLLNYAEASSAER